MAKQIVTRQDRARALVDSGAVKLTSTGAIVQSESDPKAVYLVHRQHGCSCKDYELRGGQPCKHILAARLFCARARAERAARAAFVTANFQIFAGVA